MVPVQVGEACSLGAVAFEVFEASFDDYWIYFDSIQVKTLDRYLRFQLETMV